VVGLFVSPKHPKIYYNIPMNTLTLINAIITLVGIPTIVGVLIYVGRKLQMLDDLKATSDKIKWNVKVVSDFLSRDNSNFNTKELQAYSPLQLTEDGEKLIKEVKLDKAFEENTDDFLNCIESEQPKLKYDVEIAAIKSISMLYDNEYMNPVKVFLYNNPNRSIENVAPTLGVYIRDKYLEMHPEITE
jgi:hypothetical protein